MKIQMPVKNMDKPVENRYTKVTYTLLVSQGHN